MRHPALIIAAVLFGQLIVANVTQAGCPAPANSYTDPCLIACPAGDSVFLVIVRSHLNSPMHGVPVTIDFSNCPGFLLSPVSGDEPYAIDSTGRRISMITDVAGNAAFPIRGGGGCGAGAATVSVTCSGGVIWYANRAVASPDQNGDLVVDSTDVALIQAKLGSSDASADFDCDGVVTSSDVEIASGHLGHRPPVPLSVPPGTAPGLSLAVYPNPVSERLTLTFSLPSAAHANVELLDLAGRRVRQQEVGPVGPGLHTITLDLRPHLQAGLYFLRLDQPPRHLYAKICVVP